MQWVCRLLFQQIRCEHFQHCALHREHSERQGRLVPAVLAFPWSQDSVIQWAFLVALFLVHIKSTATVHYDLPPKATLFPAEVKRTDPTEFNDLLQITLYGKWQHQRSTPPFSGLFGLRLCPSLLISCMVWRGTSLIRNGGVLIPFCVPVPAQGCSDT